MGRYDRRTNSNCMARHSLTTANATHATNLRTYGIYEFTQAPASRNRDVLFPAKLKFLRFNKIWKKVNNPNFSTFFTCCAIYDANQM